MRIFGIAQALERKRVLVFALVPQLKVTFSFEFRAFVKIFCAHTLTYLT